MAPARKPWWRFYSEMLYDPKLMRLSPAHRWLWCVILTLASDSPERGTLLIAEGMPVENEDLSRLSGVPVDGVEAALEYFIGKPNMLRYDDDVLTVVHWEARQYDSDRRTHQQRSDNDTSTNGASIRRPSSVICYLSSEGEQKLSVGEAFDVFWDAFPIKRGKVKAREAFENAIRGSADFNEILAGAQRYRVWVELNPDRNHKYPQGWLNDSRWGDDLTVSTNGSHPKVSRSMETFRATTKGLT